MNKYYKFLPAAALLALGLGLVYAPTSLAAGIDDVRRGVSETGEAGTLTVQGVIKSVIQILSWIVGIISVIMIIVSGLRFVLSGGDSSKVSSARNGIIYALIGIVVVILAQVLVRFVLDKVGGAA